MISERNEMACFKGLASNSLRISFGKNGKYTIISDCSYADNLRVCNSDNI